MPCDASLTARGLITGSLLGLVLAGCGTIQSSSLSLDERDQTLMQEVAAAPPESCGGSGNYGVAMQRTAGMAYGIVDADAIEAHLNRIASRLISASNLSQCKAVVYLIPQQHYAAVSTGDGGIFLPLGLLRDMQSDDEAAALIAHELAHIVLGHHKSDAYFEGQKQVMQVGSKVAFAVVAAASGGSAAGGGGENFAQFLARNNVTHGITENVLAPSWTRIQEEEADLLGLDLLIAAGYNKAGFFSLLQRISAWEEKVRQVEDVTAKLGSNFESIMSDASKNLDLTNEENYDSLGNSVAQTTSRMINALADYGEGQAEKLAETHYPAKERLEKIKGYTRKFHRSAGRPPIGRQSWKTATRQGSGGVLMEAYASAAAAKRALDQDKLDQAEKLALAAITPATRAHAYPRLAFFAVREEQGAKDKAELNLRIALKGDTPPLAVYRKLAWLLNDKGRFDEAEKTVNQAMERLDNPPWFFPDAIRIMKRAQNLPRVEQLIAQCEATGNDQVIKQCKLAAS